MFRSNFKSHDGANFLPRPHDAVPNRPASFSICWNVRVFIRPEIVLGRSCTPPATRSAFQPRDRSRSDEAAAFCSRNEVAGARNAARGCDEWTRMTSFQVASPRSSSMEPKTLPPAAIEPADWWTQMLLPSAVPPLVICGCHGSPQG